MSGEVKVQTLLLATNVELECPACGEIESGFCGNPAGRQFTCDSCHETYKVHKEADIEYKY
ncbi:hypothetical protein K08M3_51250 [Vibrio alginolyticus]|jgi:predicted RNA-binding Zn-ribbon protein involved in translation (DUF1610 family)|uniref:Uncharacterized protein n=1 Tax=Vibrio alginolyticus TaxID=663 RepID=A0A1W6TLT2_VIBAL|nr:hypothetical protein [Vibrio parahaemolyticus]ARP06635.1 hypothetical protein K04M1_51120 [Vibrio alginolyticus]ARP11768.1 hypothetical protein K04M3_51990 [Vibrio alginolyticus]ARP16821.1 hypothetical protein K04M5_51690 [Vibrio alginolyticus]ARP21858.1 hypothetical protein K05K4_51560 [Vibrio alginolyticus]ARP26946.1 hypothetical protein K06K5_51460 [Vibrio alginolyticus]